MFGKRKKKAVCATMHPKCLDTLNNKTTILGLVVVVVDQHWYMDYAQIRCFRNVHSAEPQLSRLLIDEVDSCSKENRFHSCPLLSSVWCRITLACPSNEFGKL